VGDEPTGDLDAKNAEEVLGLLRTLKQEFGKTVVIVTHDPAPSATWTRCSCSTRACSWARGRERRGGGPHMKFFPFVWRNLLRNKLRSLLTGAAIALAIALVCILRTMPAGFDNFLDALATNTRISIHNTAGIVYSMPYAYLSRVRSVPGVNAAVSWTWFGGAVDKDKGVTFPNFAVDADAIGVVFADLNFDPETLEHFRTHRDGALVAA